jgi:mRNA interferase YafQ
MKRTTHFKRDYKRIRAGRHRATLDEDLRAVVTLLATDTPLPPRYRDHPLIGDWHDHRDCHVKPDLILIYRKPDATTLELVRLGSHSALGISSSKTMAQCQKLRVLSPIFPPVKTRACNRQKSLTK